MKSAITKSGLAALALMAVASPAKADFLNFDYYCAGVGSLQACASVRITTSGNNLTMQVWNLNGVMGTNHTITDIGLYHAATDWAGTISSYTAKLVNASGPATPIDITNYWTAAGANEIDGKKGLKLEIAVGNTSNAGIVGCTDPFAPAAGEGHLHWRTCWTDGSSFPGAPYVEFNFQLTSAFALSGADLRWRSQQVGPDGEESLKCDTNPNSQFPCGDYPPETVVPEPGTVVLTATGLLALFGITARRRSKKIVS